MLVLSGRKVVEDTGSMSTKELEPILTKQSVVQEMSIDEAAVVGRTRRLPEVGRI